MEALSHMEKWKGLYHRVFKRLLDMALSLIALMVLSPVFLLLALLIRYQLGGPAIFKQKRPGLHGEIFMLYKFRTMSEERDEKGDLLADHLRMGNFGRFLRSTSLDELPEFFNILKGDMSLIGPRPLLVEYLPRYSPHQARRHEVRPGLSGLAQISGRNAITWEEKFDLDVEYIEHISFKEDLRIMGETFKKVFYRENISATETVTMEVFKGTLMGGEKAS